MCFIKMREKSKIYNFKEPKEYISIRRLRLESNSIEGWYVFNYFFKDHLFCIE